MVAINAMIRRGVVSVNRRCLVGACHHERTERLGIGLLDEPHTVSCLWAGPVRLEQRSCRPGLGRLSVFPRVLVLLPAAHPRFIGFDRAFHDDRTGWPRLAKQQPAGASFERLNRRLAKTDGSSLAKVKPFPSGEKRSKRAKALRKIQETCNAAELKFTFLGAGPAA